MSLLVNVRSWQRPFMNSEMYSAVDMGQTDLVTHTIDTGEHRPICLPPRRLPITKQDVETPEVQKMLDRGIIGPCQSSWASPVVLVTKN